MSKQNVYDEWFHDGEHSWQEPWSVIDASTENLITIWYPDRSEQRNFHVSGEIYSVYSKGKFSSTLRRASEMPRWARFPEPKSPSEDEEKLAGLMEDLSTDTLEYLSYSVPILRAYLRYGGHLSVGWVLALIEKIEDQDKEINTLKQKLEQERYDIRYAAE